MPVLSRILSPAPLLFLFVVITQFAYGMYIGAQLPFPAGISLIYVIGLLWAIGWWLRTDSRRRNVLPILRPWLLSVSGVAHHHALLSREDARRKGVAGNLEFCCCVRGRRSFGDTRIDHRDRDALLKSAPMHHKSLHRSGGSIFRIKLEPAKAARFRAARSQPFDS
jgi:hypothetical protein